TLLEERGVFSGQCGACVRVVVMICSIYWAPTSEEGVVPAGERRRHHAQRERDGLQVFPAQQPKHRCSLALSGHPATAAERRYVRLSRSLRVTRPRSNDVRLIVHGTPLVRKSSACEVSQSTVMRRTAIGPA